MGYARSTEAELRTLVNVAQRTGIVLDPTYTGKAFCGMMQELAANPLRFSGRRVLFIHTGGAQALADKQQQLAPLLQAPGSVQQLHPRV